MATYKMIDATEAKPGATVIIEGSACIVKSSDISKTGKHGHAKARIEAIGILDGKKRVLVVSGHERFEVPLVEKKKAQILSISGNKASVMDLETFETVDMQVDEGLVLAEGDQVEFWIIGEEKLIKRKI
jgi:translation initiation factor 5A